MMDRRVYLAARVRPLTPREISMGAKRYCSCMCFLSVFLTHSPSPPHPSLSSHSQVACIFPSYEMFTTWHVTSYLSIASFFSISCIVVDGSCTTLVNPDTGDAKAFVLDYSFDSSDPSDRQIPQTLFTLTHAQSHTPELSE